MVRQEILENLQKVHLRIESACKAAGRNPNEVQLLLATKSVPAEKIRIAIEAGEKLIGENKVQELRDKHAGLYGLQLERHFIGHLQSNKIKTVLKYVSCIQSIDRIPVAEELNNRLQKEGRQLDIFIQVNTSNEESKFGIHPNVVKDFINDLKPFDSLNIKGLMTIGLLDVDIEKMRPSLALLRTVKEQLMEDGLEGAENLLLSMGMSQDLELAIAEGSNMVRIGTSVFGNRFMGKEIWNEEM